ncbi:hypothetical protein Tco_0018227 [Tanacetum coccineum]
MWDTLLQSTRMTIDWTVLGIEGSECCWGLRKCRKEAKRVKDYSYTRKSCWLCKQAVKVTWQRVQEVPNADSGTELSHGTLYNTKLMFNVFANDIQHFDQLNPSVTNGCSGNGCSNVTY